MRGSFWFVESVPFQPGMRPGLSCVEQKCGVSDDAWGGRLLAQEAARPMMR